MPSADSKKILSNIGDNLDLYYILIICAYYNNAALILCFRLLWLDGQVHKEECVFVVGSYGIHSLVYCTGK